MGTPQTKDTAFEKHFLILLIDPYLLTGDLEEQNS